MGNNEQIEIKTSKIKLAMSLSGCTLFVTAGIFLVIEPAHFRSVREESAGVIFIAGILGILFFGIVGYFILKKFADTSPGLVISDKGITDNAGALGAGFIPWEDITAIKEKKVVNQLFINIVVKNPQVYMNKQKNYLLRKAMLANNNIYGSCIEISAVGLKTSHTELRALLEKKFDEYLTRAKV